MQKKKITKSFGKRFFAVLLAGCMTFGLPAVSAAAMPSARAVGMVSVEIVKQPSTLQFAVRGTNPTSAEFAALVADGAYDYTADDGTITRYTFDQNAAFKGYDFTSPGKQSVTLIEASSKASAIFEIEIVKAVDTIAWDAMPTLTEFYKNEAFHTANGRIKINYADGTSEVIKVTDDMCSGYDMSKTGTTAAPTQPITVTYKGFDASFAETEFTLTYDIYVLNTEAPTFTYESHIQTFGWQSPVKEGLTSGTTGISRRMEAIIIHKGTGKIGTDANPEGVDKDLTFTYEVHVQNKGWMPAVKNDVIAGTTGQSLRMEAIKINLTGDYSKLYDVYYRAHVQNIGWQDWVKNGEEAGTTAQSLRMEAIEIKLVRK